MKLKWFGHSCFLITSDSGTRILTDPFDEQIPAKTPLSEQISKDLKRETSNLLVLL